MRKIIDYRFSFGPWNISEGADPFGPVTRNAYDHESKYALYRPMGFEGVQFHDDDVVPGLDGLTAAQVLAKAGAVKTMLDNQGLVAEFVAPRLWFAPQTADGGYTSTRRPTASMRSTVRCAPSTSPARSAPRPSCCGWPAKAPTCAKPRTW